MKKVYRYLLALAVCAVIFVLWILCQMYVAKGTLVGVIFCTAMFGAWSAIVSMKPHRKRAKPEQNKTTDTD